MSETLTEAEAVRASKLTRAPVAAALSCKEVAEMETLPAALMVLDVRAMELVAVDSGFEYTESGLLTARASSVIASPLRVAEVREMAELFSLCARNATSPAA